MADIFNFTDTWNNGATAFNAIKVDVTDTASDSASLLLNLSVGGSVKASIRKDGHILGTSLALGGATIGSNALAVTGTSALSGQVTNHLGTITTSAPFTLTQTWNAGGVTFDAAVTNVTFTAGANPSYLWRGQVAGSDRFQFKVPTASGNGEMVVLSGTSGRTTSLYAGGFAVTESSTATQKVIVEAAGNYVAMSSNTVAAWFNNIAIGSGSQDTTLSRNAAGVVQFGTTSANAAGSWLATSAGLGASPALSSSTFLNMSAGTTAKSQIRFASSTAPTSPVDGDFWFDGTNVKIQVSGTTKTFTLT